MRTYKDLTNKEKLLLRYFEENKYKDWDDKMYDIQSYFKKNPFGINIEITGVKAAPVFKLNVETTINEHKKEQ